MTVMTPKTNFIKLLDDMSQCLRECTLYDSEGYLTEYTIKPLLKRCHTAIKELTDLPELKE